MSDETQYADYDQAGAFRCCLEAIPTDSAGHVLAGQEGEHRPCPYCTDKAKSGMRFVRGTWIAAWRDKEFPT